MLDHDNMGLLRELNARMGGGTVLAGRWNEHRLSTDLDIFLPANRFDQRFNEVNAMQAAIRLRMQPDKTPASWTNPQAGVLVLHCEMPDRRAIDLIRDLWLLQFASERDRTEVVHGTMGSVATLPTERILAGKLATRASRLAERDV